jgi:hypothetical protein
MVAVAAPPEPCPTCNGIDFLPWGACRACDAEAECRAARMVVEIDGDLFVRLDIVTGAVDQARGHQAAGLR